MKSRMIWTVFGAAVLLLAGSAAHAQAYKWKDANGRIVYSDQPPPKGTPPANILKSPAGSSGAAIAVPSPAPAPDGQKTGTDGKSTSASAPKGPMTAAEREADFRKRQAENRKKEEADAKKSADEQQRQANCSGIRQNIVMLESGQRVAKIDSKGERYFIEDAERDRDLQKARQDLVASKC